MQFKDYPKFKALKQKFAMETAQAKQSRPELFGDMDQDLMFQSLLLMEFNEKVVDGANEYLDHAADAESLCALCFTMVLSAYRLLDTVGTMYSEDEVRKIRNLLANHQEMESQTK